MKDTQKSSTFFNKPKAIDRFFNRALGLLLRFGLGLSHNYLLEVRGRKTGRIYSTPVDLLSHNGSRFIVAPRGQTQWVRNVLANGEATLVKGSRREKILLKPLEDDSKPEVLKAYLDRYRLTVQRYFPIEAGSPAEAFQPLTARYPVFRLLSND